MEKELEKREQLPQILLERYYLHELSENDKLKVEQFIKEHPQEELRLKEIEESNQGFFNQFSISKQLEKIQQEYKLNKLESDITQIPKRKGRKHKLMYASSLIAALLLVAVVTPSLKKVFFNEKPINHIRIKGEGAKLFLYRKKNSEIERLFSGERVGQGDLLQISFNPAGTLYHMVFSIDGRKQITLHYPLKSNGEAPLLKDLKKQQNFLKHSYELDDAPNFERFVLISSNRAFKIKRILKSAKELLNSNKNIEKSQLELPKHINQYSLVVKKRK